MRRPPFMLWLFALAVAVSACKPKAPRESLLVAGSTTMMAYVVPAADAFMKRNPNVTVACEPGGSTAGIIALKRGAVDVATMSRDLTRDEDDLLTANYLIARDGLAIIVHPANPLRDIELRTIQRLFVGEAKEWKTLGGPEGRVHLVTRDHDAPERKSFTELALSSEPIIGWARVVATDREMVDTIKGDPLAVGYLSLKDVTPEVRALTVHGIAMSRITVLSGRYPLARSFYLTVHRPSPLAERFVEFMLGADGQRILAEDGLIPVY